MQSETLDDFRDLSPWSTVASGEAQLRLSQEPSPHGHALRMDFDFHGGGGFVVARRLLARTMPESWALALRIRGEAPANKLELKLVDPTNRNVWWWHRDAFAFPREWEALRIRSSEVSFAWGPAGGGPLRDLAAIELAIAAPPGGRGTVWIEDLRFEDFSLREPPRVLVSSERPGCAAVCVLEADPASCWRSAPGAAPQWLSLDFGAEHEYGGLVVDWAPGGEARAFDVQSCDDGDDWRTLWSARQAEGRRQYVYLPGGGRSRRLRLFLREPAGRDGFGIASLQVEPFEFSRSLHDFFHAVAARERRGLHPRWLYREQSYWTPVGVEGGHTAAILNEEGLFEPDRASFSLEPFLYADGELVTWADAEITQSLAASFLPVPSSHWRWRNLRLTMTAFATGSGDNAFARVRYRVENAGRDAKRVRLYAALRPYQVTPPWQAFQGMGGTSEIRELDFEHDAVLVNGKKLVVALDPPSGAGVAAFEQGGVRSQLVRGDLPPRKRVRDEFAHASGALAWDLDLAPGAAREIELAVPFGEQTSARDAPRVRESERAETLARCERGWQVRLGEVHIRAGGDAAWIETLRTATAHILVNRDGAMLQPGPRRYTRSWIRDGATMSAALLRMGQHGAVRDFLRAYAPHQGADGNVPCAVDHNGADWLPEHDSHGQLVYTLAEHFRIHGDLGLVRELWPHALRATQYLETLRAQRLVPELRTGEHRARYGLLPESASHEGYLAHPVHAYWDDFWALRGFADAADLAQALGDGARAEHLRAQAADLARCLYASIETVIAERKISYVPGSVEWADFDPTATSTALVTTDAAERLPQAALTWSYDEYLAGFRKRKRGEIDWNNYTAYEIRILGALVRLGRREDAHELLDFFLSDRRPRVWNQWPEISWRDPRSPGHLGDVPHSWIGAEYVLAVLGMLAYESASDDSLVLAAGVSPAWLAGDGLEVDGLPTYWGPLTYRLQRDGDDALRLELAAGLRTPPGGIVVRPPLALPLVRAEGEGVVRFDAQSVVLRESPARVRIELGR